MEHISRLLNGSRAARRASPATGPAPWRRAAEAAHAIARTRADTPATLPQLCRVCQLLTSHTVRERERRLALLRLTQGCTKKQAHAMLDYLIPAVQARKAAEVQTFLRPLVA